MAETAPIRVLVVDDSAYMRHVITKGLSAAPGLLVAGAARDGREALELLATARAGPLDALEHARADLLEAQITFHVTRGRDAPPLLVQALQGFEPLSHLGFFCRELERLCAPPLIPIRRVVPLVGGVDLSPLVLLVLLQVASIVLGAIQGAVLL